MFVFNKFIMYVKEFLSLCVDCLVPQMGGCSLSVSFVHFVS